MEIGQQKEVSENLDSISNQDEEREEFKTPTVEQLRLQRISVFQRRKSFDSTVSSQQKNFEAELDELRKVFIEVEDPVTLAVRRRHLFCELMRKMELFIRANILIMNKITRSFISMEKLITQDLKTL